MAIRETDDLRGASSIGSLPSCRFSQDRVPLRCRIASFQSVRTHSAACRDHRAVSARFMVRVWLAHRRKNGHTL